MKSAPEFYLDGLEEDKPARHIGDLWSSWNTQRQPWRDKIAEIIQYVYATSSKDTSNVENPWSHTTHIPKLTQIHDNLATQYYKALTAGDKYFRFRPQDKSDATVKKAKAKEGYLRSKTDDPRFKQEWLRLLQDWVQTGNCFARVRFVRETVIDSLSELPVVEYEGPLVERISPYDIVFDPSVLDFNDSPKVIRSLYSIGQLIRMAEEQDNLMWDKSVLDKVKLLRTRASQYNIEEVDKQVQIQIDGFTSYGAYLNSSKVEVLEFIGDMYDSVTGILHKDKHITVVDRTWVLADVNRDDYTNIGQIYHSGWRKRPDNLWAQGPLENLIGMQYMIDHWENARSDAFDQFLSPDEIYIGQVETIVSEDGVTRHYIDDGEGDVKILRPDASALQADIQIQTKEAQMEAYAGAPREALGFRTPGEKTAFEFRSLQNAANRLFQHRADQFQDELFQPILNGMIEVAVKNMAVPAVIVDYNEDLGVPEFSQITREDLLARGYIQALGSNHYAKRTQLVEELQGLVNILAADPDAKQHVSAKKRAKLLVDTLELPIEGLFQPYVAIAEALEAQELTEAAQSQMDQFAAASQGMAEGDLL